jgi:MFS family permease
VSGLAGDFDVEPLTLVYGVLADWLGVQRVMFALLGVFAALTVLAATAASIGQIALLVILRSLRHVTLAYGAWLSA